MKHPKSRHTITTVVGARPQFIKAAVVSRALQRYSSTINETVIHTGQHYDVNMSDIFFHQMSIPSPSRNLGIGGSSHAEMTGKMLIELEKEFLRIRPKLVLVYGDTNSTLAGALAAGKLNIPVVHVEAGLRSFNKRMPEEQNRIITDHLSDLLLVPTETAAQHLRSEGLGGIIHNVGDVMYDASIFYSAKAKVPAMAARLPERFVLMTLHRAENTATREILQRIIDGIAAVPSMPLVFPLHPRTRIVFQDLGISIPAHVTLIEPVGYLEMIFLEQHAEAVITDSGGVQKEAYFFRKPCGTLRSETEWTETLSFGANQLLGADSEKIARFLSDPPQVFEWPEHYGDGHAGERIVEVLEAFLR